MQAPAPFKRQNETCLDDFKMRLTADIQPGAAKKPFLEVRWVKNCPAFCVKTNVPADAAKNNGVIRCGLDAHTAFALLELIRAVAQNEQFEGTELPAISVNNVGPDFKKGGQVGTLNSIKVGRHNGRVFICCIEYGRPKIPFYFGPTDYHKLVDGNDQPINDNIVSSIYAMGYAKMLENLLPVVMNDNYVDRETVMASWDKKGQNGGGQQQGSYQPRAQPQQQQQYQPAQPNAAADFDDSIPF